MNRREIRREIRILSYEIGAIKVRADISRALANLSRTLDLMVIELFGSDDEDSISLNYAFEDLEEEINMILRGKGSLNDEARKRDA